MRFGRNQIINVTSPVNWGHTLNVGRAAWWLAIPGRTGGPLFYDLMGLYPGTLAGMASDGGWRPTTRPGGFWHLLFDGSNDYVNIGSIWNAFQTADGPFTIGCWFRSPSLPGQQEIIEIGTMDDGPTSKGFRLLTVDADLYGQTCNNGRHSVIASSAIAANSWYRSLMTYSAPTMTLYLNGLQVAQAGSGVWGVGTAARLGDQIAGGAPFIGTLDDVFASSRCWSAAEVMADYALSQRAYPGVLNRVRGIAFRGSTGNRRRRVLCAGRTM